MALNRRYALGGLFVLLAVVAGVLLWEVVGTVFFAVTVAYLLLPVRRRLVGHGLSRRWASVAATTLAFLATVVVLSPLVVAAVVRLDTVLELFELVPDVIHVELFGFVYEATLQQVTTFASTWLRRIGRQSAAAAPVLLLKATLFTLLVFSLLYYEEEARTAVLAVVPPSYRGVAEALNDRARETLLAIYVLQAATAAGTFVLAFPVFYLLGYQYAVTLSVVAAVLQFVPILGPSILLAGLAAYHLAVGQVVHAILVFFAGGFVIGWLPDVLIRPRLAKETADIPGSLYFVGFFGGLLTLGPIGIVAGPLVVGLVVESALLLSEELNGIPVEEKAGPDGREPGDESAPPDGGVPPEETRTDTE
ncbi:Predicted PurR-regulated permease PerM [Halopelagius inordinatus]|uniref:Predicted PurR-regulated permease PerM n=1 Tax=Halopelagius inordinatus TaxID=553467 RepID=A0A1I2LEM6_9EURY|nr:AI-2E family transporter [Halopelagius inordinatus]SFF75536.1 Predicted PurR-regulated permease PerM [Halopelagius inordinatus]